MVNEHLIDAIKDSGIKKGEIARRIGITHTSLNNKLYGRSEFSVPEALKLIDVIGYSSSDFHLFFCFESRIKENKSE